MSQRAVALAVRDKLKSVFDWDSGMCGVRPPPGKPPASCGEMYVAVWEGGMTSEALDSRDDRHQVNVTLTRRVPVAPDDLEAEELIHRLVVGLEVLADQVASAIHADLKGTGSTDANNYSILNTANAYLIAAQPVGSSYYGFVEPLRFLSATRTEEKGAEWVGGDPMEKDAARAITLYFGKSRRLSSNFLQS